jgi:hypothetical protein
MIVTQNFLLRNLMEPPEGRVLRGKFFEPNLAENFSIDVVSAG